MDRRPIRADQIGSALAALFEGNGEDTTTRSASRNVILCGMDGTNRHQSTEILETLASVHPSRFFVVEIDEETPACTVSIGGICARLTKEERSCSEVIWISAPAAQRFALPSLVRGNSLPGRPSEMFLVGWKGEQNISEFELMMELLRQVDVVLIDSRSMVGADLFLECSIRLPITVVDLNWVRLAPWREQIRMVFDREANRRNLRGLHKVRLEVSGLTEGYPVDATVALMAGWIIDRLGLDPVSFGREGCECRGYHNEPVLVDVVIPGSAAEPTLECIQFLSAGSAITICRKGSSEGAAEEIIQLELPDERNSAGELLERYFLVGESLANYMRSLRAGLDFQGLRGSYFNNA